MQGVTLKGDVTYNTDDCTYANNGDDTDETIAGGRHRPAGLLSSQETLYRGGASDAGRRDLPPPSSVMGSSRRG